MRGKNDEVYLVLGLVVLLGFIFLSVSEQVGNILSFLTFGYGLYVIYQKKPLQFIKKVDATSFVYIAVSTVIWIFFSFLIAKYLLHAETVVDFMSLIKYINTQTNVPVLSKTVAVVRFVWGVVFPMVETIGLLGLVMAVFGHLLRINLNNKVQLDKFLKSPKRIWFMILVGVVCSLYHLATRQGESIALFSDMIFFSMSVPITMARTQLFEAFGLHTIINLIVLFFGGNKA